MKKIIIVQVIEDSENITKKIKKIFPKREDFVIHSTKFLSDFKKLLKKLKKNTDDKVILAISDSHALTRPYDFTDPFGVPLNTKTLIEDKLKYDVPLFDIEQLFAISKLKKLKKILNSSSKKGLKKLTKSKTIERVEYEKRCRKYAKSFPHYPTNYRDE